MCCNKCLVLSSSPAEPLWQPARKQEPGKVLKTIYTFSTMWANEAADAVVSGKHASIILFHQNQPKGPGFHRHPPGHIVEPEGGMTTPRKNATATEKGGGGGGSEEGKSGRKRKSRRESLTTENPTSASKKRRSITQKNSPSVKTQSPPPFLRSSRRLRSQWNPSPTPPPPPPDSDEQEKEDEDEADEKEEEQKTPTPPPPPPARSSGPSQGRVTRASQRLASARKEQKDPICDQEEGMSKSPVPKDNSTPDAKSSLDKESSRLVKMAEEEDKVEEEEGVAREDSYKSPESESPQNLPSQTSDPPPALDKDNNYTICHGTPRPPAQSPRADISSPKEWQQQQQQQQQLLLQQQQQHNLPQYPVPKIPEPYSESTSDRVVSPGHVGGAVMDMSGGNVPSTSQMQEASGVSASSHTTPSELPPAPPHYTQATAESYHQKEWGGGVLSGHGPYPSSIPGGYHPGMYPHPMHGMPYASPGQPPIAGHNYPYTMAYSWGHPSTVAAAQQQHHQQQQGMPPHPPQARLGDAILQGRQGIMAGATGEAPSYSSHSHLRPPLHATATGVAAETSPRYKEKRKSYSDSPSTSPAPAQGLMGGTAQPRPPGADMLLLGTAPFMGSSQRELTPRHQLTHGFLGSAAHQISHEHLPHHPFPYPFEPSSHPSLHMWQQSQMQGQQIRPISGVPHAHLTPSMAPHGLWYGPAEASIPSHLVQGRDLVGSATPGKKTGSGGRGKMKRDGSDSHSKMAANRNNSNNNNSNSTSKLQDNHYVAEYQAKAFPNSVPNHSADLAFSRQLQRRPLGEQSVFDSSETPYSLTSQPSPEEFLLGAGAASSLHQLQPELENSSLYTASPTNNW